MEAKGFKQIIDESISFWGERQRVEHEALNKVHIDQENVWEITEAVMFMNHEDKMKIFKKHQKHE
jgi:hypothetical protein